MNHVSSYRDSQTCHYCRQVIATAGPVCLQAPFDALAAAARQGGDVQQAPGEAPQSGGDSRNAPEQSA